MVKRRNSKFFQRVRSKQKKAPPKTLTVEYLLERGTPQDMRAAKARTEALLKFNWRLYSELALQRSQIQDELKSVLIEASISNYRFQKWQRAVKYKYGLHPLSTVGSLSNLGQRFNTGADVNSEVPSFPALYLACDKDTALQETLAPTSEAGNLLTSQELALMNPQSEVIVSVSGQLEKVFDLRSANSLEKFTELIKSFELSDSLCAYARELGISKPDIVTEKKQLQDSLLEKEWRKHPTMFDVPANSQIFGYLVYQAGIEGILYPSKLTGKECLAVFPRNFAQSSSCIALDDATPHPQVPNRIDSSSWRQCDLNADELIETGT